MNEKRFSWKTEKLQHSNDEVLLVVDNENKDWKGHILNIVDLLNELSDENIKLKEENEQLKSERRNDAKEFSALFKQNLGLKRENEQLKKELKRCKDWINSDKNDYELTLAFIKNKGYSLKDVLEYEKELEE